MLESELRDLLMGVNLVISMPFLEAPAAWSVWVFSFFILSIVPDDPES